MTALKIHHVGLTVADLQQSIDFYCGVLGFSMIERGETTGGQTAVITGLDDVHILTADLSLPGGHVLELIQYLAPIGAPRNALTYEPGNTHIAVQVGDIVQTYKRLKASNVVTRSEPIVLRDAGEFWTGAKVLYALDPDGRTVEIVEAAGSRE